MKMCGLDMNTGISIIIHSFIVPYWKTAIVTVVYVLFSSFTALFFKSLYTVVAMTGSLGGSLIEAIIPAIQGGIRINIKNTNDPDAPGTFIVPPTEVQETRPVTGIANSNRFAALYLHRYLLNKEVGFTLRILEILKRHNISYEHMPSGIDDLTIIFDKTNLSQDKVDAMLADIAADIKPDTLKWLPSYGIIMIVGEGMRNRIGALTEIVTPLKENGISLQMVNQGASEISIMLGIQPDLADSAVKAIYNNIFKIE